MPKTVEEIKQEISQKSDALIVYFKKNLVDKQQKGMKLAAIDVVKFILECATNLVEEVEKVSELPGPKKKEVVIASMKDIYWKINPDIPFLPEAVETPLEKWLLDLVLPPFVDFIVGMFNEKGIFA